MVYTTEQYTNLCAKELKERVSVDAEMGLLNAVIKHMGG